MANSYNDQGFLWTLDTADIISMKKKDDADSPLVPICVEKIRFRPATSGEGCTFQVLDLSNSVTLAVAKDTYTVTSTSRITDDDSGAVFNGAAAGMWAHITNSSSGNNQGWFLITAVDGSKHYIDVEDGTRALTNEVNKDYTIDIYTPEDTVVIVSDTGDTGGASINTEEVHFGCYGRRFVNLAMSSIDGGTCDVHIR